MQRFDVRGEVLFERDRRELQERLRRWRELSPERRTELRRAMHEVVRADPRLRSRKTVTVNRKSQLSSIVMIFCIYIN